MFDNDERIIVLAQHVRRRVDVIVVDTPFARDCSIEGVSVDLISDVITHGHLRTVREMKRFFQSGRSMSEQDVRDLLEGMCDLHLITTNRFMPLTMEEISMNPSGMPLAPRTPEDMYALDATSSCAENVPLPNGATPLMTLLSKRRSVRAFARQELTDAQVASLDRVAINGWGDHRSIPSAGGLYPCRVVTLVRRGQRYHRGACPALSARRIKSLFVPYAPCAMAPMYFVILADYERATKKYGARGWRYAMLEAGHAAQNIELHALELGLGACEIGAFKESVCVRQLALHETEVPLIVVAVGYEMTTKVTRRVTFSGVLTRAYVGSSGIVNSFDVRRRDPCRFPDAHSVRAYAAAPVAHRGAGMDIQVVGAEAPTREQAIVKAIAEGVERFSAGWIQTPDYIGTIASLDHADVIHPNVLQRYASTQSTPKRIEPFTSASSVSWYKMEEWGTHRASFVAGDFLFYPYGKDGRKLHSYATANGVAAHTDQERALWGATSELLERESLLAWWFSGSIPPILQKESAGHLDQYVNVWKKDGVEIRLLDITTSIPCVCAVAINHERRSSVVATSGGLTLAEAATHACSEVLRGIAGLEMQTVAQVHPRQVRTVEDHLKCFASGYAFEYVDAWSSGSSVQLPAVLPKERDVNGWLCWVIDKIGPLHYYRYELPRETFRDQPLVVIRAIIPGVVSIKFGYGEQDLGLPRLQKLMRNCREVGSTMRRTVPKIHPLA